MTLGIFRSNRAQFQNKWLLEKELIANFFTLPSPLAWNKTHHKSKIITHKYWHRRHMQQRCSFAISTSQGRCHISTNFIQWLWFLNWINKKEVWLFKLGPSIELTKLSYEKHKRMAAASQGIKTHQKELLLRNNILILLMIILITLDTILSTYHTIQNNPRKSLPSSLSQTPDHL